MSMIAIDDPELAKSFLESVRLPRPPAELEGVTERTARSTPPEYNAGVEQAVTVGSQIAEFAENVPAELRPQISNSFLLAQLAANREVQENEGDTKAWYERYVDVLANIGWLVESNQEAVREVSGSSLEVHQEIVPVITAILGPAVAAKTVVVSVLKGLAEMDKDQPWITLFDRESQRASANQFQISYAVVDEEGNPRISLVCFELDASRSLTQVLFFKFTTSQAKLTHFGAELGINPGVFEAVKEVVENRVAQYVTSYIADIQI